MLEKSWDGYAIHAEAGHNIGKPCYGCRARHFPYPVPSKRAKGVKKTFLDIDAASNVHDILTNPSTPDTWCGTAEVASLSATVPTPSRNGSSPRDRVHEPSVGLEDWFKACSTALAADG